MYDEKLIKTTFERLRVAREPNFIGILEKARGPNEKMSSDRFIAVMIEFKRHHDERTRMYGVVRAMLTFFVETARKFVLRLVDEKIFGGNILNLVVRINYYSLLPTVILYDLFAHQHSGANLQEAVVNFSEAAVRDIVRFVACHANAPDIVIAKMKECDFFRNFEVDIARTRWSESTVKQFIEFVCQAIDIEVPQVARPLFLRVAIGKILPKFFRGEVELADFYQICVALTADDPDLFAHCLERVAEKSNPLAKYMSEIRNIPFSPNPDASNFLPICPLPFNRALHGLACGRATPIGSNTAAIEFGRKLSDSQFVAIHWHRSTATGKSECTLFTFRLRDTVFYYSRRQSRNFHATVLSVLQQYAADKRIFVFGRQQAEGFLLDELNWVPSIVVDASDVAERNSVRPTLADMANSLGVGEFCRRGLHFTDAAWPSHAALQHLDIAASIIYEFCLESLNLRGREMRDAIDSELRRKRERDGSGARSSSSSARKCAR